MKTFDESQQKVIEAQDGYFLVLAPPGCGKTELLTHRINLAHEKGINYDDMLCLTFTNRAARNMRDRIKDNAVDSCEDLFVGNIHRFCSRFIYDNHILPASTSIIDELDQEDILDELGVKKYNANQPHNNTLQLSQILKLAALRYQKENNHPQSVWVNEPHFSMPYLKDKAQEFADLYCEYKKVHDIIDFDDILNIAYSRMLNPDFKNLLYSDYHWIQVDEVQDLNNIQFAIIDKLTSSEHYTVMFLGDEQQAIYSFMGAKLEGLKMLVNRCKETLRLYTNYRSPKYLLDKFNTYAIQQLDMDKELLPQPYNMEEAARGMMNIFEYGSQYTQLKGLTRIVQNVTEKYPEERVGILVRKNSDADTIANSLDNNQIPYFKLSGRDVFKGDDYKTLTSHFAVVLQDTNYYEWARILWKTQASLSFKDARVLVSRLRKASVTPLDLINYGGSSSYVAEFLNSYQTKELVLFDTETTGLNVFEDDIIQIAAIKVRNGVAVPGSEFNVLIRTEREIPPIIKNETNPMIRVYNEGNLVEADKALISFLEYVGGDEVLGHNVNYDYQILRYNLLRRCGGLKIEEHISAYWDSLKLIRIIQPHNRNYDLKSLLETSNLEGQNTHKADDDVLGTKSLVDYCAKRIVEILPQQQELWKDVNIQNAAHTLTNVYSPIYNQTLLLLYSDNNAPGADLFVSDFERVHNLLSGLKIISPIPHFDYVLSFLKEVFDTPGKAQTFWDTITTHLSDMKSFSQADLCDSGLIKEKVYIMTVHKAKGLEFEHVVLYEAIDGNYPFFKSFTEEEKLEDARVFYVGLSRAKKRISILYPQTVTYNTYTFHKQKTPFLDCIIDRFSSYWGG